MPRATDEEFQEFKQIAMKVSEYSGRPGLPRPGGGSKIELIGIEDGDNDWMEILGKIEKAIPDFTTHFPDVDLSEKATQIFRQLSPSNNPVVETCIEIAADEGQVDLTDTGCKLLFDILEVVNTALAHCVNSAGTVQTWRDAISHFQNGENDAPVGINAKLDKYTIKTIVDSSERYNLNPEFQRDFVWTDASQQKLITSILLGIPLPSVIINSVHQEEGRWFHEVVDGKQRLSTILRFVGKHPKALEYGVNQGWFAEGESFEDCNPSYSRCLTNTGTTSAEKKEHFLPFKTESGIYDQELKSKYYWEIKNNLIRTMANAQESVQSVFTTGETEYQIPIIKFTNASQADIHYVFERYNKEGLTLKPEELRNSAYHNKSFIQFAMAFAGYFVSSKNKLVDKFGFPEASLTFNAAGRPDLGYKALGLQDSRYALQKTTLWIASILFSCPPLKDGNYGSPSTKVHIDRMLKQIEADDDPNPILDDDEFVSKFGKALLRALKIFLAEKDSLPGSFMKKSRGNPTQNPLELPVVTILSALIILDAHHDGDSEALKASYDKILDSDNLFAPNKNTQSNTQWMFLGKNILECIEASDDEINIGAVFTAFEHKYEANSPQPQYDFFKQLSEGYAASPFLSWTAE